MSCEVGSVAVCSQLVLRVLHLCPKASNPLLISLKLDGSTALHQAAFTGTIEMVALLLSLGADGLARVSGKTKTKNNNKKFTKHAHNYKITLQIFLPPSLSFPPSPLPPLPSPPPPPPPPPKDFEARTPLHWSTKNHDPKVVEILLDKV